MTNAAMCVAQHRNPDHYVVQLLPGEGLWDAKRRWHRTTGRRGIVVIR